jgi:hypothetical protein
MEEAQKKAEEDARATARKKMAGRRRPERQQVEVDFDVKNTGAKKAINGFDTTKRS